MQEGWTLNMQWAVGLRQALEALPESGLHDTPASSEWRQLCSPQALFGHCSSVSSLPVQRTSSSNTRFELLPKCAFSHALATPLSRQNEKDNVRPFVVSWTTFMQPRTPIVHRSHTKHGLTKFQKKKKKKNLSSCLTCISQRHLNLRRNNEPDSFSGKQMFFMACSSQREWRECLSYFWRQTTTNPHTHSSALLASTVCLSFAVVTASLSLMVSSCGFIYSRVWKIVRKASNKLFS